MTESEWLACAEPFAPFGFLNNQTVSYKTRWQGWVTVRQFPVSERKRRLFATACCTRVERLMPMDEARRLLRAAGDYADGSIDATELEVARRACDAAAQSRQRGRSPWLKHERDALYAATLVSRTEAAGRLGTLVTAARARAGAIVWERYVESLGGVLRVDPGEFAPLESIVRTCDRSFLTAEMAAEAALQAAILRDIVGNPFRPVRVDPAWLTWEGGLITRMARAIYDGRRFHELPIMADALEDAGCEAPEILAHCRGQGPHVRGCWLLDQLLHKE